MMLMLELECSVSIFTVIGTGNYVDSIAEYLKLYSHGTVYRLVRCIVHRILVTINGHDRGLGSHWLGTIYQNLL